MKRLLIAAALALSACGAADAVADCHGVCSRYRSCFNAEYDADTCEKRCNANAAYDSNYRARVDSCDACIDPKSCTTAFACATQCSSVVP